MNWIDADFQSNCIIYQTFHNFKSNAHNVTKNNIFLKGQEHDFMKLENCVILQVYCTSCSAQEKFAL
jgi:hypothetical protein